MVLPVEKHSVGLLRPLKICMQRLIVVVVVFLSGCSWTAYSNKDFEEDPQQPPPSRASFTVADDRGDDKVLVVLALSGGGSRAAYFSSRVMLRLQEVFPEIDILKHVDVISSVSGGSVAGAYYCFSMDGSQDMLASPWTRASGRQWDQDTVTALMKKNYLARWVGNWFWPQNIALYWTTPYDRSDIMAQTLADNLFDVQPSGENWFKPWKWGAELRIGEINHERPYLVLNATNGTEQVDAESEADPLDPEFGFGKVFAFTTENFYTYLKSDINRYPVSNAVVASAAFPAAFNYVTLRDYHEPPPGEKTHYLHLFDGGNSDNLGLLSVRRIIKDSTREESPVKFDKVIVIAVDAYTQPQGVDRDNRDPREHYFVERFVDLNFMQTIDSLMSANRTATLNCLSEYLQHNFGDNGLFYYVAFEELESLCGHEAAAPLHEGCANEDSFQSEQPQGHEGCTTGEISQDYLQWLKRQVDKVSTSWQISDEDAATIDTVVDLLVNQNNQSLMEIKRVLLEARQ